MITSAGTAAIVAIANKAVAAAASLLLVFEQAGSARVVAVDVFLAA